MVDPARLLLGLTFEGKPIFAPPGNASSLVFAAMGGGKTTCVAVPAVQALIDDKDTAIIINDVKDAEIAMQIADMCIAHGRKFGVIDDLGSLGANYPHRISLNPFGAAQAASSSPRDHLPFAIESTTHALIDEPANDQRNFYWRESPRNNNAAALGILLRHNPRLATPGGVHAFMADPHTWESALELEAEDPDSEYRFEAAQLLAMKRDNPEHYTQHLRAALTSLKIFAKPPLSEAGRDADVTHEQLLHEKWVVCIVSSARYAERLGPYFAQHILSFMHAQLGAKPGRTCMILDEYCNAPLREAVNRITIFRAYKLQVLFIAQSRQDSIRKYGERETAILEDNCAIKQWLRFSNFEEAERVSRAMGEAFNVSRGLNVNSDKTGFSGSMNMGRQRLFTAGELMNLPDDEQILHVAGIGFIHAKKIRQNQIAPTCFELADNPLEGGRLTPDPKVDLTPRKGGRRWSIFGS